MRTKFILLLIAGLLVSSSLTRAESPQDYSIAYTFKNPDGTTFRIIKYYLYEGIKFRTEYYSSPVEYNMSASAEASTDLGDSVTSTVKISESAMSAVPITSMEPHTIEILRKDKTLVWSLNPEFKNYIEVPLREDSWERAVTGLLVSSYPDLKKTGEVKLLDYPCDVYESVMMVNENNWTSIITAAQGMVLKRETWRNGKLVEIMEAAEFSLEKPASSLFEIPGGYQKNDNN